MTLRNGILFCCAVALVGAGETSAQASSAGQASGAGQGVSMGAALGGGTNVVLVDGKPIGAAEAWDAVPVGKYDIVIATPDGALKGQLNLSNNGGKLAAELMTVDNGQFHPLEAIVTGTDLQLNLNRPKAPITIHLQKQGDRISGKWWIGDGSGTLEGVAQK
jgi:hypothetical protein